MQPEQRILNDEIISGRDELGVLLMGHPYKSWWCGSLLSIDDARAILPHQSATTMQVAGSIVGASIAARHRADRSRTPRCNNPCGINRRLRAVMSF